VPVLQELVAPETAGDPMSAQTWVRSSLRQLSRRLTEAGHPVSPTTVGRLLKSLDYALHVNAKKVEAGSAHPDRDAQFAHIAAQRQSFQEAGQPIISVDTKKKELIGNFKNAGQTWSREAEAVNVHDFLQEGLGRAVPYGIYDVTRNHGLVSVGSSCATPQFAVDVLARWWDTTGCAAYPQATKLLILADGGGSNASRSRVWKQQLQEQMSDTRGLTVTVCHYPPGCSKWNPIEHRLFGPISVNWAGQPLRTFDTMLAYLRGTTTATGLPVDAVCHDGVYATGQGVSDAEMATLQLDRHASCPTWNYTLRPRCTAATGTDTDLANRELIP
jgi:hypothetical protein